MNCLANGYSDKTHGSRDTRPAERIAKCALAAAFALTCANCAHADTNYYKHTFFDNSPGTPTYYYSEGHAVAPSLLQLPGGKLPVDSSTFFTGPNSLRISWQSRAGGSWEAQVHVQAPRNREILFQGDTLYFWCYSSDALPASLLPRLRLSDTRLNFSKPLPLASFASELAPGKWTRIAIPLVRFRTDSLNPFDTHRVESLFFEQGVTDGTEHTLFVDEIRIDAAPTIYKQPAEGRVALRKLNLDGDRQADLSVHGGERKAVCCYSIAHYEYWKKQLPSRELPAGIFGENFTTDGLLEDSVHLGDRFSVGSAEGVVTQPRLPCYKLGIRFQSGDMVKGFLASARTGFYLAVTREGDVGADDEIGMIARDPNAVPVSQITRQYIAKRYEHDDATWVRRALRVAALPESWKAYFRERIAKMNHYKCE